MLSELATQRSHHTGLAPVDRVVLDTLSEVGVQFTTERQLDPALDRLLGTALHIVRADAGSVMLLSRERDTLVVVAARGPRARTILGTRQPADRSVAGWALRAGETVLLHGSAHEQGLSDHPRELASSVVVPLALSSRLVGVMNASRERREQQVLEQLVDGLTNREIALRLVVEPDTVKDHVQSIVKKLGATDRTHAAVIAVRGGLVS
jgi:DNA-binding NarL/FixJ family response regulator